MMKRKLKLKQLLLGMIVLQTMPGLGSDLSRDILLELDAMTESATSEIKGWYTSQELSHSPIPLLEKVHVLKKQFESPAGVTEGYTIEEHTGRVLERFYQFKDLIKLPEQISERDFTLFLSLHDIGKHLAKTQVQGSLFQSKVNEKTLEIIYSRRIFKKLARHIGMNPKTVKILSRLLHSDTIGDYLKGTYSQNTAYNLLVRDAGKCGLRTEEFFHLHTLFHQIDAGSYPTLQDLFVPGSLTYAASTQEKITNLERKFQQFENIKPELENKIRNIFNLMKEANQIVAKIEEFSRNYVSTQENLDVWSDPEYQQMEKLRRELEGQVELATTELGEPLYQLRLDVHHSGKFEESLSPILNLLQEKKDDIALYAHRNPESGFCYNILELEKLTQKAADISAVHGSNSGLLTGLMQTSATLYPTGILTKLGITPMSGELGIGVTIIGVNNDRISGDIPANYSHSLDGYASSFHVTIESLCETVKNYIKNHQEHYKRSHWSIVPKQEALKESQEILAGIVPDSESTQVFERLEILTHSLSYWGSVSWNMLGIYDDDNNNNEKEFQASEMGHHILSYTNFTARISFKIKQLRTLASSAEHRELLNQLKEVIQQDITNFKEFQKTRFYLKKVPEESGGMHGSSGCAPAYLRYLSGLELCVSAFDQEFEPLSSMSLEIMTNPFPILFATTLPWQLNGTEVNFNGPLMVGKDIPYMFVPENKIDYVTNWVDQHVPGKKKPAVVSIEQFNSLI